MDKQENISLLFDKQMLHLEKDLLMCFAYVPPEGASFYNDKQETNGVQHLELDVLDLTSRYPDTHLLLAGDFNARTGNKQDFICNDNVDYMDFSEYYPRDGFDTERSSRDTEVNNFGESLLELCCSVGVHMLNGRYSDRPGEFTCLPTVGKSVVDYIIMDTELHSKITDFSVLPRTESDHQPVTCELKGLPHLATDKGDLKWTRYKWKEVNREDFLQRLCDNTGTDLLSHINECLNNGDVDCALQQFEGLLTHASESMQVKEYRPSSQPPWWDTDCEVHKQIKYQNLRKYRRSRTDDDLDIYKRSRQEFKQLCKAKTVQHRHRERDKLLEQGKNPRDLWKCMKYITRGGSATGSIDSQDWYKHFETLTNGNKAEIDEDFRQEITAYLNQHDQCCQKCANGQGHYDCPLSTEIGVSEIKAAICNMKPGKAPGPDGFVTELYKNIPEQIILPLLCKLYNLILEKCKFPEKWCQAIICPLYKGKGSIHAVNNYRGISLINVIGKILMKVMNARLVNWAESQNLLRDEQIGYRKGYCTADHLFSLQATAQKYLSRKRGRLYILYVDFSKAFDCIQHDILWFILLKSGCHGNFMNIIRDMYSKLSSCVKTSFNSLSNYFKCEVGTRQGCMISPSLFVQFINVYINMLDSGGCKGIFISEELPNLLALMYADDIGNMTDTVGRLQAILNELATFCKKFGMKVNADKTQIMVFRNGGPLRNNEKWFYNGQPVRVTSYYDYLGLRISCVMKWGKATQNLALKALKAVNVIKKFACCYQCTDVTILLSLFDKMVLPIVMYGAEVWGTDYITCIEKVQTRFCKYVLGVGSRVSDLAALGECGRKPLFVQYYCKVIKYWIKLLQMNDETISKKCYWMLKILDENKRYNWVTNVKGLLFKHGFGYVWFAQEIGDAKAFLHIFKQRVADCAYQEWHEAISNSPKLSSYSEFKSLLDIERYLVVIPHMYLRRSMTMFRCSAHNLAIEKGRHLNIERCKRVCVYCQTLGQNVLEDELHFLLICPLYNDVRDEFIPNLTHPNFACMIKLLNSKSSVTILNLCKYIYYSFNKRQVFMDS
jgi:hypothetical protein